MAESNPEGSEWPTQVDILENDEQDETPEQTEIDEHENAHMPAVMAKEIKEMISQEVAKAHVTALSHLKEYFGNTISQTIKEELIANFVGRVKEVVYSDFSACDHHLTLEKAIPFYVTYGFKMLRERLIQENVPTIYGLNLQLTFFAVVQKNGRITLLLQRALMLPEICHGMNLRSYSFRSSPHGRNLRISEGTF
ncbi:hypothetical protein Tco_1106172 [Tanacetum coccineum]